MTLGMHFYDVIFRKSKPEWPFELYSRISCITFPGFSHYYSDIFG